MLILSAMIAASVTTHILTAYPYVHDELFRMLPASVVETRRRVSSIATAGLVRRDLAARVAPLQTHVERSGVVLLLGLRRDPSAPGPRALRLMPAVAALLVVGRACWTLSGAGALARIDLLIPTMGLPSRVSPLASSASLTDRHHRARCGRPLYGAWVSA